MANQERNLVDAVDYLADAVETIDNPMDTRSDFNGWSIADSMGYIAEALLRIAEAMEQKK